MTVRTPHGFTSQPRMGFALIMLSWSRSSRKSIWLQGADQAFHPLVDGTERVLAQHGALGLVVELEVRGVLGDASTRPLRNQVTALPTELRATVTAPGRKPTPIAGRVRQLDSGQLVAVIDGMRIGPPADYPWLD